MNRLETIFAEAAGERRLVIPYICAGDPNLATSQAVVRALGRAGADIIELGIPFADPIGDGPVIAASAQRALAGGMTLSRTIELASVVRGGPAVVLFGYLNPIVRYGVERFATDIRRAGVSGVIVPDLPFEEAEILSTPLRARNIATILLIAPTTPLERAVRIAHASDVFVYVVSRSGVTGAARAPEFAALVDRLRALRVRAGRRIAVGFGISDSSHVAQLAAHTDAVVVGSALVDALSGRSADDAASTAGAFIAPMVAAAGGTSRIA
jgi:tryptophan synthase alpha chain